MTHAVKSDRGTAGFAAAIVFACSASGVFAATATWNGDAGTNWDNPLNWTPHAVPTSASPASDVIFSLPGNYASNLTVASSAGTLTQTQGSLSFGLGGQTLAVTGGFTVNGTSSANPQMLVTGGGGATVGTLSVGVNAGNAGGMTVKSAVSVGGQFFIGQSGGTGKMTVDGTAGSVTVGNDESMFVGYNDVASNGTLNLTNGGSATARNIYIGYYAGQGSATVSGPGSVLTVAGTPATGQISLNIGSFQHFDGDTAGTLVVSNGGTLNTNTRATTAATIGGGGTGTLTIQDGNSKWTHTGPVQLGGTRSGTLNVSNGATVNITSTSNDGTLQIGANGSLNLSGSTTTLNVDSMDLGGNAANVHFTAGTLKIAGAIKNVGPTPLSVGGTLAGRGSVAGSLTVAAGGTIQPGDGTSADLISVGGNLNLFGTMQMRAVSVNGAGTVISGSTISVAGNALLNGVVAVSLASGLTPPVGASFDLLDVTGATGGAYTFDFSNAPLPAGRQWNTSQFAFNGSVSVETSPEPGSALLGLFALSPLAMRRRSAGHGSR